MPDPLGPVVITVREIYDQLVRLTTAVEGLLKDHGDTVTRLAELRTDHETRLRALERARWPLPSIAALLGAGSLVVAVIALLAR
jgi:hypothetical protein